AAARPVDVRAVLEQDIDIGEAEIRKAAHHGDTWGRQQGSDNGIGNLIFHEVRRAPHPGGVDNDLSVGDVRDSVDRDVPHGPPARHAQTKDTQEHNEPITGAEVDNALDHTTLLCSHTRHARIYPAKLAGQLAVRSTSAACPSYHSPQL